MCLQRKDAFFDLSKEPELPPPHFRIMTSRDCYMEVLTNTKGKLQRLLEESKAATVRKSEVKNIQHDGAVELTKDLQNTLKTNEKTEEELKKKYADVYRKMVLLILGAEDPSDTSILLAKNEGKKQIDEFVVEQKRILGCNPV